MPAGDTADGVPFASHVNRTSARSREMAGFLLISPRRSVTARLDRGLEGAPMPIARRESMKHFT
jgi:hypothetical protein